MAPFLPRRGHPPVPGQPVSAFKTLLLLFLATSAGLVSGQAYSFCNPLKEKCPPAPGFPSSGPYTSDFRTGSDSRIWTSVGKSSVPIKYGGGVGAVFSINKQGDSPVLESDQYIFFGTVEVHLRAASGQGIINCIVLLSDTLDEIDFELLGGAPHRWLVQSNYFGKGETGLFENGESHYLPGHLPSTTTGQVHNYTIDWDRDKIVWFIDGVQVRRLDRHQARPVSLVAGRDNFPQTPARVRIGLWAGGDPGNEAGTIEWAGGVTSFDRGELPYEMVVERVRIVNRYPAAAYWFRAFGGQWEGVEFLGRYFERGDRGTRTNGYGEYIESGYAVGIGERAGYEGQENDDDDDDAGEDTDSGTDDGGYGYDKKHGTGAITVNETYGGRESNEEDAGPTVQTEQENGKEKESGPVDAGIPERGPDHDIDEPAPGSVGTGGTREGGAPGIPDRPVGTPVVHLDLSDSLSVVKAKLNGPWRLAGVVAVVAHLLFVALFTW